MMPLLLRRLLDGRAANDTYQRSLIGLDVTWEGVVEAETPLQRAGALNQYADRADACADAAHAAPDWAHMAAAHTNAAVAMRLAAEAERALGQACWTRIDQVRPGQRMWWHDSPHYVAVTHTWRPVIDPVVTFVLQGPDGDLTDALPVHTLVRTGDVHAIPGVAAMLSGGTEEEAALWAGLGTRPEPVIRSGMYEQLAHQDRFVSPGGGTLLLLLAELEFGKAFPEATREAVTGTLTQRRGTYTARLGFALATAITVVALTSGGRHLTAWMWVTAIAALGIARLTIPVRIEGRWVVRTRTAIAAVRAARTFTVSDSSAEGGPQ